MHIQLNKIYNLTKNRIICFEIHSEKDTLKASSKLFIKIDINETAIDIEPGGERQYDLRSPVMKINSNETGLSFITSVLSL